VQAKIRRVPAAVWTFTNHHSGTRVTCLYVKSKLHLLTFIKQRLLDLMDEGPQRDPA
jgi:hypothetical protein